jgi:hypothetical protein
LAPGVPQTITDALGDELTEPHQTVSSYGGVGGSAGAMRHGQGGKKDEVDNDTERFFRAVDRSILERHSRPSGLPLIVAALPEHQSVFEKVSNNPFLLPERINIHPDAVSIDQLRELAWNTVEPRYHARLTQIVEEYEQAKSKGLSCDELAGISSAAVFGRVKTLLVEADREIPGHLDSATGHIQFANLSDPHVDDLLDDLSEKVLEKGGQVVVVPAERMPTKEGAGAIYRY